MTEEQHAQLLYDRARLINQLDAVTKHARTMAAIIGIDHDEIVMAPMEAASDLLIEIQTVEEIRNE